MSNVSSTVSIAFADSATMLRRRLRHMLRYPTLILTAAGVPVAILLLFVYVLGGALGDGVGTAGGMSYVDYVVPGVVLMTVATAAQGTAISVSIDMTEGIVARFRTMAIARVSVLTGHVLGSLIQTMLSIAAVVGVALLVGFRPTAALGEWLGAIGVLAMIVLALTWLSVALAMVAKSVATASNMLTPLMILPMTGSGFVPTDSMPTGLRWFAEYQPFTPFIETLRGLLMGTPMGDGLILTVGWCAAIGLGGYLWAKRLYNREPTR
ncbi:ABC-2 type transport system permease protein [Stackebrandtia albiflava]|uniref:Transport permease protein n=1 Tax=Stackebrandtia albiflava TaxID=406432 RepID=A0A562VC38_9ACTN|nr:ABC transporter permease [Stackebrandtia albiflava]TWJ15453.1 ABC-2 type transport system permease protein [Stackebrandtia albiflava]